GDPADRVTNALEFRVVQVLDLLVERNVRRFADLTRPRAADAEDRRQADLGVLTVGDVDARNTCHGLIPRSALTLLVPRIGADHANHAVALDDLAVAADLLDGSQYLHDLPR